MKKFLLVLALLSSLTALAFASNVEDFQTEVKMEKAILIAEKSAVSIFGISGEGMDRCSGVLIRNDKDKTIVLTAKHCVNTDEELYVENILVKDIGVSKNDDIAYFELISPIPNKEPIKISNEESKLEDFVFSLGYPNGNIYLALGRVINISSDWQFGRMMVVGGCSGGGVYNINGQLVGILWGGFKNEPTSIFEPLNDVKKFIKDKNLL